MGKERNRESAIQQAVAKERERCAVKCDGLAKKAREKNQRYRIEGNRTAARIWAGKEDAYQAAAAEIRREDS